MDEVLQLLPEGVSLYEKTSGLTESWHMLVYGIFIIGFIFCTVGLLLLMSEQENIGEIIVWTGLIIALSSVFIGFFGDYEDTYQVTVSENANIDALEENFNIVEKDDFLWTVKLKYDGTKKMWQD